MGKHKGNRTLIKPSFQVVFLNVYVCVSIGKALAEEMTEHRQKKCVKQENVMKMQCR